MSQTREASSPFRGLIITLVAMAVALPCHAIEQKSKLNEPAEGLLIPKVDNRCLTTERAAPGMLFGSVSTTPVESSAEPTFGSQENSTSRTLDNLAERDVFLLIDHTGSMMHEDCPGGFTRWDWLRRQILSLSEGLEQQIKGKISLVPFAVDFKIYQRVNSPKIKSILKRVLPAGSTHPEKALETIFDSYFAAKAVNESSVRPLLVVVVSDGVPNEPDEVINVITKATARMIDSREILVTFLQVGNDQQGNSIMDELDCDLVHKNGARFDIINRMGFREVQSKGLENCLLEAFESNIQEKKQVLTLNAQ